MESGSFSTSRTSWLDNPISFNSWSLNSKSAETLLLLAKILQNLIGQRNGER